MRDTRPAAPLSDLIDIKHGYPFSSQYFVHRPTEYILLTPRNFTKDQRIVFGPNTTYYDGPVPDGFVLQEGDLLIVMTDLAKEMTILGTTAVLQLAGLGKRVLHNQRIGKVIDKGHRVDRKFLMYLLNSSTVRREVKVTATGTTVRHTSPGKILGIRVWIPVIPEQEKIAGVLSRWDRVISLTERLIAANRQRRKALAQKLLSGRQRFPQFARSTLTRKMDCGIRYPVDWDCPRIGEIARPVTERNNKGNEPLPVLSCTKHRGLVDSSSYFGKRVFGADLSAYKVVRRSMFAYATNHLDEGSIGYQTLHDRALVSPMYTVFETSGRVVDEYLYLVLKTSRYRHIFAVNTNASVNRRGGLRWKEFAGIRVPLPSKEEQEALIRVFSAIDRQIDLLHKQQLVLWKQRNTLMDKLLGGQWRVQFSVSPVYEQNDKTGIISPMQTTARDQRPEILG